MSNPNLKTILDNSPNNFLARIATLERQVEELQVGDSASGGSNGSGSGDGQNTAHDGTVVFHLALFPAEGVTVTDPQSSGYIGGFIASEGLDFGGNTYNLGGINAGVIQVGINTADGTLYAINANISGVITIGAGSTAGGWVIDSDSIHDAASFVGLSSAVTGGNDLRIWAGSATPASAGFRVYEDGAMVSTSATITGTITANTGFIGGATGWVISANTIKDVAGLSGMSNSVTGGDDIRFWAGNAVMGSAPFRVSEAGVLTASSGTVGGWTLSTSKLTGGNVNLDATGKIYAGATDVLTGNGFWFDYDTGAPVSRIGTVSGGVLVKGYYWDSTNLQIKATNFTLDASGNITASNATLSGTITATTGAIGGWSIGSNTISSGSITLNSATPSILMGAASAVGTGAGMFLGLASAVYQFRIGDPAANNLLWNGSILSANGQWIKQAGLNPSLQTWTTNISFSSASDTQINWTSGTVTLGASGTSYSISAGNTGTMSALTYIYIDTAVSLTVFQTTTTYTTAVGDGKILIATAQNATAGASVLPQNGQQPIINGGAQITALSILAGNIAAGAITATKISVTSLSAITATMGSLTIDSTLTMNGASGAITIGSTPPSSATVGTGLWIDRSGIYSLSANVQNATLTSAGLTAAGGAIVISKTGVYMGMDGVLQEFNASSGDVGLFETITGSGLSTITFSIGQTLTVTNPGFESGSTGWTLSGAAVSSVQAHSGTNSLLFNANSQTATNSSFITVSNAAALFRFWMYGSGGTSLLNVFAAIACYDGASAFLGYAASEVIQPLSSTWKEFALSGKYLAGTTKIKVYFQMAGAGMTAYVDDIKLYDGWGAQTRTAGNGISVTSDFDVAGVLTASSAQISGTISVTGVSTHTGGTITGTGGDTVLLEKTGTFVPRAFGTTSAGTGTYTTQNGAYWTRGRLVYIEIELNVTAHTGTGNLRVDGLPYTKANNGIDSPLTVQWSNITLLAVGNKIMPAVLANTSIIAINEIGSGAASALPLDTSFILRMSGMYLKT